MNTHSHIRMTKQTKHWRISAGATGIALFVLFLVGCDSELPPEPPVGPSFVEVQQEVFSTACADCHGGNNPAAGLDLSASVAYDNIVNIPSGQRPELMLVEPGASLESYLYIKLIGGEGVKSGTFRMPIGGTLEDEQIALVAEWIDAGAEP